MWAFFRTVHGARVGIVGTFGGFFSYPLFGLDDSNRVALRRAARPTRLVHRHRHVLDCGEPRVNAADLRYLVTLRPGIPGIRGCCSARPSEAGRSAIPRLTSYSSAVRAGSRSVFRLSGPLHPQGCSG